MKRCCLSCLVLMVLLCGAASGSTEAAGEQALTLADLEYLGNPFSARYPDGSRTRGRLISGSTHQRQTHSPRIFALMMRCSGRSLRQTGNST